MSFKVCATPCSSVHGLAWGICMLYQTVSGMYSQVSNFKRVSFIYVMCKFNVQSIMLCS